MRRLGKIGSGGKANAQTGAAADWLDKPLPSQGIAPRPLVGALYRIGVLAAAMNQPEEAKAALARLLAIDPDYKDARQRLDNLP